MSTQSLDEVLAGADASDQEIATDAGQETEVSQEAEVGEQQDDGEEAPELDAHGALHAERNRVRRKYTDTVADFDKRLTEANTGFEKKLTDTLAENDRRWEQRFNQFSQQFQQQPRREPEAQAEPIDMFANPDGFVDHRLKQSIDPIKSEFAQFREHISQRDAIREHGKEKVQAAFQALDQAARAGDPEALATAQRVKTASMDPYGDIMDWHQKTSVVREVGNDPDAFIAKRLADPEFRAKHGLPPIGQQQQAPGQKPAPQSLPSLNRVAAAADDDEEEEDAGVVFNSALRRGVQR